MMAMRLAMADEGVVVVKSQRSAAGSVTSTMLCSASATTSSTNAG